MRRQRPSPAKRAGRLRLTIAKGHDAERAFGVFQIFSVQPERDRFLQKHGHRYRAVLEFGAEQCEGLFLLRAQWMTPECSQIRISNIRVFMKSGLKGLASAFWMRPTTPYQSAPSQGRNA